MKGYSLLVLFASCSLFASSQNITVSFENSAYSFSENYGASSYDDYTVQVNLSLPSGESLSDDIYIRFNLSHSTSSSGDVALSANPTTVLVNSTNLSGGANVNLPVQVRVFRDEDHEENDEVCVLNFESTVIVGTATLIGGANSSCTITVLNAEKPHVFDANVPFRFYLGGSFDLFNEVTVRTYAQMQFRNSTVLPGIRPLYSAQKQLQYDEQNRTVQNASAPYSTTFYEENELALDRNHIKGLRGPARTRLGIDAGIYRNVNNLVDSNLGFYSEELINFNRPNVDITRTSYLSLRNTTVDNLGGYFDIYKPLYQRSTDERLTRFYYGLHFESIIRSYHIEYDYKTKGIDTINYQIAENDTFTLRSRSKIDFIDYRLVNHYIGPLLSFEYATAGFECVIGFSPGLTINSRSPETMQAYYLWKFNLMEKNLGFSLGGEVRGIYGSTEVPYFNIYLSKAFNLQRLGDYLKLG